MGGKVRGGVGGGKGDEDMIGGMIAVTDMKEM